MYSVRIMYLMKEQSKEPNQKIPIEGELLIDNTPTWCGPTGEAYTYAKLFRASHNDKLCWLHVIIYYDFIGEHDYIREDEIIPFNKGLELFREWMIWNHAHHLIDRHVND